MAAWRRSARRALASNATPIWPDRLCDEITRALPPDGILVADTGYSSIWSSSLIELNGEGQTYLRAAGSLGWSVPGGARREMRGAASKSHLLVRRRRTVLPPDGTGNRAAARHRGGAGGQQQLRLRPGLAEHPAPAGQQAGRRRANWCASGRPISPTWRACSACAASASRTRRRSGRRCGTRWHRMKPSSSMSQRISIAGRRSPGCRRGCDGGSSGCRRRPDGARAGLGFRVGRPSGAPDRQQCRNVGAGAGVDGHRADDLGRGERGGRRPGTASGLPRRCAACRRWRKR